jgi:hypothetical protein
MTSILRWLEASINPGAVQPVARVVPDGGGERQQALGDPGGDPGQAAAAVQLQIQLALEGVVDRLDQLADRGQQRLAGTGGAVAVGRAQQ